MLRNGVLSQEISELKHRNWNCQCLPELWKLDSGILGLTPKAVALFYDTICNLVKQLRQEFDAEVLKLIVLIDLFIRNMEM